MCLWEGNQHPKGHCCHCHHSMSVAQPLPHAPSHTLHPCYTSCNHPLCPTALPYSLSYPSIICGPSPPSPLLSLPSCSSPSPSSWSLCLCPFLMLADSSQYLIFEGIHHCCGVQIHCVQAIDLNVNAEGDWVGNGGTVPILGVAADKNHHYCSRWWSLLQ